jgi:hypothetical protein
MTPTLKKWILRPLLIIAASAILLIGALVIFLIVEEDRLVKLAFDEINDQYKGNLTAGTSEVSFLKHFPSIGFTIHDVKLFQDKSKTDSPVLAIDRLYIGVRPLGLVSKNHHVRRLSLNGGKINLVRSPDGSFNIAEAFTPLDSAATTPAEKSDLALDLEKISIKGVDINYRDLLTGKGVVTQIKELSSTFKSETGVMRATLDSKMEVHVTSDADTTFFRDKEIQLNLIADYREALKLLELTKGNVKLEDASFNVEGKADLSNGCDLDFKINGDEPDFHLIAAFLPEEARKTLKTYSYDGHVYFDGIVKGKLSHDETPYVEVSFGCKDAWFANAGSDKKIEDLGFGGYYTNGDGHSLKTSEIHIMDMKARPGKGIFRANFALRDFTHPQILMQVFSELELSFLGAFLGIKDLQQFTGKIKLEMDFKEIMDINTPEQSLSRLKEGIQSKLTVTDLSFRIPGYPHAVRDVNLHATMSKGQVTVDSARVKIGNSDLRVTGSLSDIQGFIRNPYEPITVKLNAVSKQLLLRELLAYDTALARTLDESIHDFSVGLSLETCVYELLHPTPLPNGDFTMTNLRGNFKNYAHTFKNLDGEVRINDSILFVDNLSGAIDSSDMKFSGSVKNYGMWLKDLKSGRTEIAFDLKSTKFALRDVFTREVRRLLPRGYRREELTNANMKVKMMIRYDTTFRFMRTELSHVTCGLKRHKLQFKDVSGKIKYGANKLFAFDTLTGTVGKSDFDITMRLINTESKTLRSRTNYFHFKSNSLDADEIAAYDFSVPPLRRRPGDTTTVVPKVDTITNHAKAFNVFTLPFSDFNVWIDVGKFKYNKLWIKDFKARARLTQDHFIHLDTLGMKIARGTISAKGILNGSDTSRILVSSTILVDQLDLENVMVKLDNFGKDVVINKNIKGHISGEIKSSLQVHPNLVPLIQTTTAQLRIQILDGSLVDFAPMQAMASYFKDKNLRLVRFDSLKNELTFSNGVLNIPTMDINSSLGAIQMSGKQSLDLNMEYYMRIPMKMVTKAGFASLFGKKEQVDSAQVDEVVYANKEKKGLFVHVKVEGTPNDYKVSLKKKGS